MSRRRLIGAALASITLGGLGLIAGCSAKTPVGLVGTAATASPSTTPSASSAPAPPTIGSLAPLTGTTVGAGNGDRTVLVPIGVSSGGHGPAGLGSADLVGVDYAEQGTIRLIAAFQSRSSSSAGPVTELRPSESRLFAQTDGAAAESGTPSGFLAVAKATGLSYVSTSTSGVYSTHHGQPYANVASLRSHVKKKTAAPLFEYATAGQPVSGKSVKTASTVSVHVSGHSTMVWHYDATTKLWNSSINGTKVTAANLVVLTTPYTSKYVHALKRNVTFAEPQGGGSAQIVAGPQAITASWFKKYPTSALNMLGPDQTVPQLTPGSTWIFMVPKGSSVRVS